MYQFLLIAILDIGTSETLAVSFSETAGVLAAGVVLYTASVVVRRFIRTDDGGDQQDDEIVEGTGKVRR
jgi:hypothetical protein